MFRFAALRTLRTFRLTPVVRRGFSSPTRPAASAGVGDYVPAEDFIKQEPVKEVEAPVVRCDGGPRPEMGHPVEFIKLTDGLVSVCKYCGVRYVRKGTYNPQTSRFNGH